MERVSNCWLVTNGYSLTATPSSFVISLAVSRLNHFNLTRCAATVCLDEPHAEWLQGFHLKQKVYNLSRMGALAARTMRAPVCGKLRMMASKEKRSGKPRREHEVVGGNYSGGTFSASFARGSHAQCCIPWSCLRQISRIAAGFRVLGFVDSRIARALQNRVCSG